MSRVGDVVHLDLAGRSTPFRPGRTGPDVDRADARWPRRHGLAATGPADVVGPDARRRPGGPRRGLDSAVEAGDPIVTLEAMKMEHVVTAPIAGRVGNLTVRTADQVTRGQLLATIDP